jgi:hypothetical protein
MLPAQTAPGYQFVYLRGGHPHIFLPSADAKALGNVVRVAKELT